MKAALAACVLFAVGCGRHDTPVASYSEPLPDSGGGGMASAGSGGSGGNTGGGGGGGTGGVSGAADAGAAAQSACVELYTTIVPGLTSHYRLSATGLVWIDAERDCESDGGHLVVIDDDAENDWVKSIAEQSVTNDASTNQLVWIGLEDHAVEGQFRWVTDAPLGAPRWAGGEPNNRGKIEDCGELRASGEWNDDRCNARPIFICECDGAVARGWCDTDSDATCGDCSTSCPADQTCVGQVCK